MIREFSGEFSFLSNFFPAEVEFEGTLFPTVEHAFQAAKTHSPIEREFVRQQATPGRAKRAGAKVTLREDWLLVRMEIMFRLVRQKFSKQPLKQMLQETGQQFIMEGNRWGDTFWGVDLILGEGQNALGFILMEVRRELFGIEWETPEVVEDLLRPLVQAIQA